MRDLQGGDGGDQEGAARKRRRLATSRCRLDEREGEDGVGDDAVVELRRRRIVYDRGQRSECLAGKDVRAHEGPGVVDQPGAQAGDQGAEAKLDIDEGREGSRRQRKGARGIGALPTRRGQPRR